MKTSNHLLRRLTAALLAAVLALSIALPVFASDDGDTIYINSVSDLLSLARSCAYDQWSVGKTVILQKDLSLEGMLWEPIPSFSGQFKGNGHTISDLTITGQYSPAGLFGIVEEQGSIESLSVRGVVSVSDSADTTTGGIVGINHGTLINCQFTGVVTGDSEVGGIVGRNESEGTIDHSTARAIVTGKSSTGGIAGYNLGAITGCTNVGSINTEYPEASLDTDGFTAKMVDYINNKMAAAADDATNSVTNVATDTGGIAGRSSGMILTSVNTGTIGYEHVGYNVAASWAAPTASYPAVSTRAVFWAARTWAASPVRRNLTGSWTSPRTPSSVSVRSWRFCAALSMTPPASSRTPPPASPTPSAP